MKNRRICWSGILLVALVLVAGCGIEPGTIEGNDPQLVGEAIDGVAETAAWTYYDADAWECYYVSNYGYYLGYSVDKGTAKSYAYEDCCYYGGFSSWSCWRQCKYYGCYEVYF